MSVLFAIGVLVLIYFLSNVLTTYIGYFNPIFAYGQGRIMTQIVVAIILAGIALLIYSISSDKQIKKKEHDEAEEASHHVSEEANSKQNQQISEDNPPPKVVKPIPGKEPEDMKIILDSFLQELNTAFPDKRIIWKEWNHARWDKTAGYLSCKCICSARW